VGCELSVGHMREALSLSETREFEGIGPACLELLTFYVEDHSNPLIVYCLLCVSKLDFLFHFRYVWSDFL
jgi:hypothetical protein